MRKSAPLAVAMVLLLWAGPAHARNSFASEELENAAKRPNFSRPSYGAAGQFEFRLVASLGAKRAL
jgi:hypothetical protein